MRIDEIALLATGPFRQVRWPLTRPQSLHVFYGPNEAGKSSTLRSLGYALFGFPRSPEHERYFHSYDDLRVGLTLSNAAGEQWSFIRRKTGSPETSLRAGDDVAKVTSTELQRWLGPVDEPQFEQLWGLNHPRLVEGGHEILAAKGDIAATLFSGSGLSTAPLLRKKLVEAAESQFKSRGHTQSLNKKLKELEELDKTIKQVSVKPPDYVRKDEAFRETEARVRTLEAGLKDLRAQERRLNRWNAAIAPARKRLSLKDDLAVLADLPDVAMATFPQARELEASLRESRGLHAARQRELDELPPETPFPTQWTQVLERDAEIDGLIENRGAVRKGLADAQRLQEEAEAAHAELNSLARQLNVEEAGLLRVPTAATMKNLDRLVQELSQLASKQDAIDAQRRDLARPVDEENADAAVDVPQGWIDRLEAACDNAAIVQAQGARSEIAARELAALDVAIQDARSSLGLSTNDADRLVSPRVPGAESLITFARRFRELSEQREQHRSAIAKLSRDLRKVERDLAAMAGDAPVITPARLIELRDERDRLWGQIRTALREGTWSAGATADELTAVYGESVREADLAADNLRTQAERVARHLQLSQARDGLVADLQTEKEAEAGVVKDEESCRAEWVAFWEPFGVTPGEPTEMQEWQRSAVGLQEQLRDRAARAEEVAQLTAKQQVAEDELRLALQPPITESEISPSAVIPGFAEKEIRNAALGVLLSLARQQRERCEQWQQQRHDRRRDREQTAERIERLKVDQQGLDTLRQDLARRWEEVRKDQPWLAGMPLDQLPVTLDVLRQAAEALKTWTSLSRRVEGITHDSETFLANLRRLHKSLELPPVDDVAGMGAAIEELRDLRLKASTARTAHETQRERRRTLAEAVAALSDKIRLDEEALREIVSRAGVEEAAALPLLQERLEKRDRLTKELKDCEAELQRQCDHQSVEDLVAEVAVCNEATLLADLRTLEDRIAQQDGELAKARDDSQAAKTELEAMNGESRAAVLAEQRRDLLCEIEQDAREYLRLQGAAAVLQEAMNRYREQNQGPILARASHLFDRLTGGAFLGLRADLEGETPRLLVVQQDDTTLQVSALSDGTADQLYLAIRLAYIQQFLETNEPFPLILDDILIQFDDDRARLALEVLGELSRQTQVLFFTHHARLVSLAEEVLPPEILQVTPLKRLRPDRLTGLRP